MFDLDVIVGEVLPVDDFVVNLVIFSRCVSKWVGKSSYNTKEIIEAITEKKATMLPDYINAIHEDKQKFDRIKRIFHDKEWKVYFYDREGNNHTLHPLLSYGAFCDIMRLPMPSVITIDDEPTTKGITNFKLPVVERAVCKKTPGLTFTVNELFDKFGKDIDNLKELSYQTA